MTGAAAGLEIAVVERTCGEWVGMSDGCVGEDGAVVTAGIALRLGRGSHSTCSL